VKNGCGVYGMANQVSRSTQRKMTRYADGLYYFWNATSVKLSCNASL